MTLFVHLEYPCNSYVKKSDVEGPYQHFESLKFVSDFETNKYLK